MLVDHLTDPRRDVVFRSIAGDHAFCTRHAAADLSPNQNLPRTAFAYPELRLFPVHTGSHAALSLLYGQKQAAALPPAVLQTIRQACDLYGVSAPTETAPPVTRAKMALAPNGALSLGTPRETVRTTERLAQEAARFSPVAQVKLGTLLHRAHEVHQLPAPAFVERWAGLRACDTARLRQEVDVRASSCTTEGTRGAYFKLSAALRNLPPTVYDPATLRRAAYVLHELDHAAGLTDKYGAAGGLADPLSAVFNSDKRAEPSFDLGGGQLIPQSTLASLPLDFWERDVGPDVAADITDGRGGVDLDKLQAVLPTLPRDVKTHIAAALKALC